jgi:carbonic anhydrase
MTDQHGITADEALARLIDGNKRFIADDPAQGDVSRSRRLEVARGQNPFAALVGCSDSRVGPELLFGVGLGDLFIVRSAGNNIGAIGIGSVEFSVAQLGVPLVVVLGHERCGAVQAAIDVVDNGLILSGAMARMVEGIVPAVIEAKRKTPDGMTLLEAAARENVHRMVDRLRHSHEPILQVPQDEGRLKIVGAYYDLDTGTVDFFDQ